MVLFRLSMQREFEKADYNNMLATCVSLIAEYNVKKVYIDGANPAFIRSLKDLIGERPDYEEYIAYLKRMKWGYKQQMTILPVPFSTEHKEMLGNVKNLVEHHIVAIHPQ